MKRDLATAMLDDLEVTASEALEFVRKHHAGRTIRLQFFLCATAHCVGANLTLQAAEEFLMKDIAGQLGPSGKIRVSVSIPYVWITV